MAVITPKTQPHKIVKRIAEWMGVISPIRRRFVNNTNRRMHFRAAGFDCGLPALLPRETGTVGEKDLLRRCRDRGASDWAIEVLADGACTGYTLSGWELMNYVRFEFRTSEDGPEDLDVGYVSQGCHDRWSARRAAAGPLFFAGPICNVC